MAIKGIFVQWVSYAKSKDSIRAMHFYLTEGGKSTMSLGKAKGFKSKGEAVESAKQYFGGKEWSVFEQTEFRCASLAKSK